VLPTTKDGNQDEALWKTRYVAAYWEMHVPLALPVSKCAFYVYGSYMVLGVNISLNSINELIFVMVKCGVPFEVRTEFLNIICRTFGFKGLSYT
jgi:hypothetical protein